MHDYKEPWKIRIAGAVNALLHDAGQDEDVKPADIVTEIPPRPEMGDLGFPMFGYAKRLRKGPPQIAAMVCEKLTAQAGSSFTAEGPYVNVRLDRAGTAAAILPEVLAEKSPYGRPGNLSGQRIMVEFSSPNTNKPLHLGHLRNDVLGESVSRILAACGAEVRKVCIINDRGVHICKSMLAYKEFGEGKTPESEHLKSDHFVGDWYVKFHKMSQEDKGAEERAQDMLRKWEAGDPETVELWKKMNAWTVNGMKQTYERTGVSFDQYYYESQTYLLGKDEILKGLEKGIFYREEDGSVQVDLTAEKLDKKVLLRKDGTSIYITQDIGTAIYRHKDWPFDRLVFVVGSEQQYHFKVLFTILDKLGFVWAKNLYHLSYGMVNLPEGKMKSREGTVVDADDLIDSLKEMALTEIRSKDREDAVGEASEVAEKIALGALHYFLLQVSPAKDMLFDPKESLSFNGNTGPYLQYMGARISSLLRKAEDSAAKNSSGKAGEADFSLLTSDAEWELIKVLGGYNDAVAAAAVGMDPSFLAAYLYEVSRTFSRFYHDCPILNTENPALAEARLALSRGVLRVLRDALNLVCIPFLEIM
ncbi:arginine--tRNA ligase [Leadbettera azotonutricia]|uniref:Arginine--tRNA ligase n=1 Tax=Leadbettera azotonutricia (strain ATCC BAA-888 / DSM 13862 / ZAS-9) TaxID=545695 RepID=F5Y7F2_LEAAZ|nr:arginine--tRNA ligase [Leadbettera azotonutricia]AEF81570.1 arginine--tRNA ligase [Leadbettera azotonutricia ZAS-9]